ncbi:type II secretion system inner membrane protein GspF [Thiofaba sp. EF100]|uniref:type II secretion system inner membrane protein GspF n=1 Tax=Thiofaba sp. EF100 TaxID=3121274 RepID=UPI0032213D1F
MPAFSWTALDDTGRTRKGVQEGDSARLVRQALREQGLTPLAVEQTTDQVAAYDRKGGLGRIRGRIGAGELALITRQLATLVQAGLPIETALGSVARQSEKAASRNLIHAARSRVMEGHTLAAALSEYPRVFPELYRATVAAGEESGHLDAVLERLADYTEAREALRRKIQLALFYPGLLTLMAVVVVMGLLTYVVPQVTQVFEHLGQELPELTQALLALSGFLRDYGLWLLGGLATGALAFRRALRHTSVKRRWHHLLLRLPLAGRLIRGVNTARFARTLGILASAGVPILEAMRIAASVMDNVPMREAVEEATLRVREGVGIATALADSKLFPPMTVQLIASGEQSGRLRPMLERAAAQQEGELSAIIATALGLFEPVLILLMGGVVLVIVLAILLPIFELNQLVK